MLEPHQRCSWGQSVVINPHLMLISQDSKGNTDASRLNQNKERLQAEMQNTNSKRIILADGAAALLSCLLRLMWPLSWRRQGSFTGTWRARSHFCILKGINKWHFIFGSRSVYSRALSPRTLNANGQSLLRELASASAEHQASRLFSLRLDQVFVCLFACI